MMPLSWRDAYIGLGSNLDQPVQHIQQACCELAELLNIKIIACSPFYTSKPVGVEHQPDFINAVMHITTRYSALELLKQLQQLENRHGRVRSVRWGARTLDLDILLFDQQIIKQAELEIPHPEMVKRGFVLYPLADITPKDFIIPGHGLLTELLASCPYNGLTRLNI